MKQRLIKILSWKHAWLAAILLASFILHFALLWHPAEMVLDEVYYIEKGARIYLEQGDLQQAEHPPLSKFLITAGMVIFGDNPLGWRSMVGLFGLGAIFFFYLILRHFKLSNLTTNIATTLFAFENSTFLMASVAMLDIFNVTFMLAGFWAYLSRRYPLAVLFLMLSALCKLTGLFGIAAIGLHWLFFRRDLVLQLAISGLIAYVGAIGLVPVFEYFLTGEWSNPFTRVYVLFTVPGTITFANSSHPSALHPWEWVLEYHVMPFWWSPQYLSGVTGTVWISTLPIFAWTAWFGLRRRNEAAFFAAAWIFATLIVWIILGFITDRLTYIFYFVPIVGGVLLGLAVAMDQAIAWAKRPRQLLLTMGDPPRLGDRLRAWARRRNWRRTIYIFVGLFVIVHLGFFLAMSPFTDWWSAG
jgi:predicted membrane-bound dolichyl-phosphate-mannose-protein mannosyltransferase